MTYVCRSALPYAAKTCDFCTEIPNLNVRVSKQEKPKTHKQTPCHFLYKIICICPDISKISIVVCHYLLNPMAPGCLLGSPQTWCQLLKLKPLISSNSHELTRKSVWQQALATEEKLTKSGFRPILVRKFNKLQAIIHCAKSPIQAPWQLIQKVLLSKYISLHKS